MGGGCALPSGVRGSRCLRRESGGQFRGGLFKAHKLVYHSTPGLRRIQKKKNTRAGNVWNEETSVYKERVKESHRDLCVGRGTYGYHQYPGCEARLEELYFRASLVYKTVRARFWPWLSGKRS